MPADLSARAHAAGSAAIATFDASVVAAAVEDLDRLVLLGIAAELHRATRLGAPGAHPPDRVADDLGAVARHRWVVGHWLAALHEAGLARRDAAGRYHGLRRPSRAELAAARTRMENARVVLGYPPELAELMLRSLRLIPELLRDEVGVQALLYPDGEPATAEAVYRDNAISRYLNLAAAEAVRDLAERSPRPLRALELGAGIGATTADLLPALAGRPVESYLFTDLSPFFVDVARRRFDAPFLRYGLLDITEELPGRPGGLDLVVAATMAHNAPHAGRLLEQVARLLAPGGRVLLIETVEEHAQSLTTMPPALSPREGSGPPPRHDERAGTTRTYLSRAEWLGWFARAGLRVEADLPPDGDPLTALSQRLFVATPPMESS
ncbi:class I SAM-dependent methyltransferase [Planomonospora sp. ID91781]|uniref:Type 12 methyltransferase n=1 Tax=Planomonospora sphaerica TaxID=161355 RepID=A0A171CXN3_9ACTN|nr:MULTISPECIES: class I SAM-dependent methyltransferase [Planomonospora]MBG0823686.1 class I SAM-dependent methyltransferase [Planomonospora sp. ID91781]GAT67387.1 type 12 methyltransferase [Planomonospora sphaerica]